ncbi:hypothetical protein AB0K67_36125, partial [Nonomuraea sp. NPDC052634]|uniref:hypothetical protein n=1 Tax=Nonomuraea sp. NPDC052634 TaxID=3155813 RepID=UPI003441A81B
WIPHTHMITAVAVSRLSLDQIEISKCGWSTKNSAGIPGGAHASEKISGTTAESAITVDDNETRGGARSAPSGPQQRNHVMLLAAAALGQEGRGYRRPAELGRALREVAPG